jgi:AraC-like DNA-binding protein
MEQVMEAMEANYNNSEFGVTELCDALGMSRTLVSRKLNAEVGVPTSQFMRDYRLDIARRLLQSKGSQRNIAEIAFGVGFNDPKYFTRCFTKKFGVSPSGIDVPDDSSAEASDGD